MSLFALLPGRAAAVSLQRVVDDMVVVRVLPRQDAGSARAAQRTGNKLRDKKKSQHSDEAEQRQMVLNEAIRDDTYSVCEGYPCITNKLFCLTQWILKHKPTRCTQISSTAIGKRKM